MIDSVAVMDCSMSAFVISNSRCRTECHLHLISRRQPGNQVLLRESAYEAASGPGLVAHATI